MNSLLGVALGVSMVVGSVLAFRHADALAGGRTRRTAGGVAESTGGGAGLQVALNRGVALATALLGVATVVLFLS
jgi:hypothetical protein